MPDTTPDTTRDTGPADEAEEQLAPELDGQSTTVEEAMDAVTDEEGFAHESAYTTPAGSTVISEEPDEGDTSDDESHDDRDDDGEQPAVVEMSAPA